MQQIEVDTEAEALIAAYCDAWNTEHGATRAVLLERVFEADGTYTDPDVELRGRAALDAYIAKVLERYRGARIAATTLVQTHHRVLRFGWQMILPDGTRLPEALDVAERSEAGKIRRVIGFFGRLIARES